MYHNEWMSDPHDINKDIMVYRHYNESAITPPNWRIIDIQCIRNGDLTHVLTEQLTLFTYSRELKWHNDQLYAHASKQIHRYVIHVQCTSFLHELKINEIQLQAPWQWSLHTTTFIKISITRWKAINTHPKAYVYIFHWT